MNLKVIDVINNNCSDIIVKIIFFNSDDEPVECFRGMLKYIPDNFKECEVLGTGFFDCALIHIKEPETKPKQLYYFTDEDGRKFFESFETPDDAPETAPASSYPLDVPFDMRIKHLCRKCEHLESCFNNDRSKVLEYDHSEPCDDVCGLCCSLFCKQFESRISKEELFSLLDDDLPF